MLRRATAIASTVIVSAVIAAACSTTDRSVQKTTAADVIASAADGFERYESAGGKFAIDFPSVWRGSYSVLEGPDTSFGARFRVQFMFKPDAQWKAEPKVLLVVRVFPRAAWGRLAARLGPPVAAQIAEKGDDIFAASLPASNPYRTGSPEGALFDRLILSAVKDPGLRLTPK